MRPHAGWRRVSWATGLWVCVCSFARPALGEQPPQGDVKASPESPTALPSPADASAKDAARAAFEQAVALAEKRQYDEAKALFLEAYRLVPHPIVAYNAALACLALGEKAEAAELLERALATGEGKLSDAEHAAILAVRSSLGASTSGPAEATTPAPAAPASPSSPMPSAVREPVPSRERPAFATVSERGTAHSENRRGSPEVGYVVGAVGAALLLGSGAVYLWNDGRHDSWSTENAALERDRDALLAAFRIPSQDPELRQRARANDERWESIQLVDAASVTMLATGLVALGVGTYLALTHENVKLRSTSRARFELAYRF